MQAKAQLRFLRMSPKKVRLVVDVIRGMKVEQAIIQLNFINKAARLPVLKLLNSAIANATNNFDLKKDNLFIKEIRVDEGGALKRWMPKAHGRATPLRKGMSHIILVLEEIVPSKTKAAKKKIKEEKPVKISNPEEIKKTVKPVKALADKNEELPGRVHEHDKEIDKEIHDVRSEGKHRHQQHQDKKAGKQAGGFIKKFFNRKSG